VVAYPLLHLAGKLTDPTLDSANVCPVEAAIGAEAFLLEASLIAEFAHDDADGFCLQIGRLDLPLAPLHGKSDGGRVEAY
jgi:hypothetical protein